MYTVHSIKMLLMLLTAVTLYCFLGSAFFENWRDNRLNRRILQMLTFFKTDFRKAGKLDVIIQFFFK